MSVDILAAENLGHSEHGDEIDFEDRVNGQLTTTQEKLDLGGQEDDLDEITFDANDGLLTDFPTASHGQSGPDNDGDDFHVDLDDSVAVGEDVLHHQDVGSAASAIAGDVQDDYEEYGHVQASTVEVEDADNSVPFPRDVSDDVADTVAEPIPDHAFHDGQTDELVDESADLGRAYENDAIKAQELHYDEDDEATSKAWLLDEASIHGAVGEDNTASSVLQSAAFPRMEGEIDDTNGEDGTSEILEHHASLELHAFQGDSDNAPEPVDGDMSVLEQANASTSGYGLDELIDELHHGRSDHGEEIEDVDVSQPDSGDFSNRPDVRVFYRRTEYSLFSKSDSDDAWSYFFSDMDALDYPLSQFLDSLHEVINEDISRDEELVMRIEGLGLEFSETMDKKFLDQTTFGKIIDLHHQLVRNDESDGPDDYAVVVFLVTRLHCSRRLENLLESARNGEGLASLRFSYPEHLTRDLSPDEDEAYAQGSSDVSGGDLGAGNSAHNDEDDEGAFDEDGPADQEAESAIDTEGQPDDEDGDMLLGGSYDQVVDEAAPDGLVHSTYSGLDKRSAGDAPGQDAGRDTVSADVLEFAESEELEGSAQPNQDTEPSEQHELDNDGASHVAEDGDSRSELWHGDSGVGADSHENELDFDLENPDTHPSEAGANQDQTLASQGHPHAIDESTDLRASHAAEEIDAWDGNDLDEDANPPLVDEHVDGTFEEHHDGNYPPISWEPSYSHASLSPWPASAPRPQLCDSRLQDSRSCMGVQNSSTSYQDSRCAGSVHAQELASGVEHSVARDSEDWDILLDAFSHDTQMILDNANMLWGHKDHESGLNAALHSPHGEWDAEPELDFDTTAAVAGASDGVPAPTYSAQEIASGQTSASATLNGDEIDFEEDGLADDSVAAAADDGHERSADAGHQIDPDEIDWEDNDVVAAGTEATADAAASPPGSITGKRGRELDDSEESGEGHEVKRLRA